MESPYPPYSPDNRGITPLDDFPSQEMTAGWLEACLPEEICGDPGGGVVWISPPFWIPAQPQRVYQKYLGSLAYTQKTIFDPPDEGYRFLWCASDWSASFDLPVSPWVVGAGGEFYSDYAGYPGIPFPPVSWAFGSFVAGNIEPYVAEGINPLYCESTLPSCTPSVLAGGFDLEIEFQTKNARRAAVGTAWRDIIKDDVGVGSTLTLIAYLFGKLVGISE